MSGRHTLRRLLIACAVGLAGMLAVPWLPAADAAVLVSIDVTPSPANVPIGATTQFTATGHFLDGTTANITSTANWTSSVPAAATVNNVGANKGKVTGVALGGTTITATSGVISGTSLVTVVPPALVSIDVTPSPANVPIGVTMQFTATGHYTDLSSADITSTASWTSSVPAAATVNNVGANKGKVTGVALGGTTITATSGLISGTSLVTVVAAQLVSIDVTPSPANVPIGVTTQFTATGHYTDLSTADITTSASWTSSVPAAATVNNVGANKGKVTGVALGGTTITATSGLISGTALVTVIPATLVSIDVTPSPANVPIGVTTQFTATGHYTDLSTQDITSSASWTSSVPSAATVNDTGANKGKVTGVALGATTITATSGLISGTSLVTVVSAQLVSIDVTPSPANVPIGATTQFTATGHYTDLSTLDITASTSWTSSVPSAATVNDTGANKGKVTGVALGATTITATSGLISGTALVTVTPPALVSIDVTPSPANVPIGVTTQFTATGHYTDLSTQDLTSSATWTSSVPSAATVNDTGANKGKVTGVALGATTITASSGLISGTALVTVIPPALVSIDVTPSPANVPIGVTTQFTATGHYTDLSTQDLTSSATWTSSVPSAATVNDTGANKGKVTGVALGATTITATSGLISGTALVTVVPPTLVSIDVTPSPANVPIGVTTQFTATGHYTDLSSADITTSATWTSSVPSAATVNDTGANKGKVTGVALGATTITATSGLISGTSLVTVVPAELVTITVDPLLASIPKGTTQQYTATGHYTDLSTQDLTTHVVWSSSAPTVATISNANGSRGLATGVGLGTTVITATDSATNIAGVAGLGVTAPVLVAINISPPVSTVARGGSEQLTAEGVYSDLTTAPLTDVVTWSSLFPANATISDTTPTKGLVTGVAVGGTTITATDPATGTIGVATVAVTPFLPLPQIYISDEAVNEPPAGGTATATFTIELSAPSAVPVTVTASSSNGTAAAGSDYNALLPTLVTFTPGGPLTQTVSVTINGDDFRERNENFIVRLQSPVGATLGDDTGVGRILDPLGRFTVFVRDAQVVQSPTALTTAHFAVELNAAPLPGETVTVQVATADLSAKVADNDYAALGPITLTFDSTTGNSIDVPVTVRKSTPGEGTEQFMLVASSPSPNLQISDSFGVGAIYNGAIPSFPSITIQDPRVVEPFTGTATLTYRIRLSKPTSQTVKVTYATTNDGTATPGIDYVPVPPTVLTFLPNETQKLVNVTVNGDAFHERVETVKLTLSGSVNAVIGDTQGVGRIRDQLGRFAVYVRDASVTQSSTSTTTARFVVSLSAAPIAGESVNVAVATAPFTATAADGDYVPLSQTLTFGPGVSSQNVDVTVNAGPASEADEFFVLQLVSSSVNAKIADVVAAGNISAGA